MADDEVKVLADAKKLPMPERVAHANWKARNAAYSDIGVACQRVYEDSDPCLNEYGATGMNREDLGGFECCPLTTWLACQGAFSPRPLATAMLQLRTRPWRAW